MTFSTVPIIFLAIAWFWIRSTHQALRRREITRAEAHAVHAWLGLLAVWGLMSTALALEGVYRSDGFYRTLPGFWVPMIPVAISLVLLLVWPTFRNSLWIVTERTSPRAFLWIQSVRIAAIGGIVKAAHGLLPASFVYPVGGPDFVFGLLSLLLAIFHRKSAFSTRLLIGWNIVGMAVLIAAPLLMQLGLPGPFYVLDAQPDARVLFEFPIVLAPTLVVTTLFFMNGWHAFVLLRAAIRARPVQI